MDTVHVKWNGRRRFVGWDEAGHGVVMDSAPAHQGDGSGARPIELVDGDKLVKMFEKLELGLTPRTIFEVDDGFLEEFRK